MARKIMNAKGLLRKLGASFFALCLCVSMAPLTAFANQAVIDVVEETVESLVTDEVIAALIAELEVIEDEDVPQDEMSQAAQDAAEMRTEALDRLQPQNEDTVVMIGDQEFSSLEEALFAMNRQRALSYNSVPLDFVQDVTGIMPVLKDVTINLNGFTWTAKNNTALTCTSPNVTVTINGPGTMQAANGYRLIEMEPSSGDMQGVLNLNNLTLRGNGSGISSETAGLSSKFYGGIVFAEGVDINATNCTFQDGVSKDFGGAIAAYPYSTGSDINVNLVNCTFKNNSAMAGTSKIYGSAVALLPGGTTKNRAINSKIVDCTFENNKGSFALAIGLDNSTTSLCSFDTTVTNTKFIGNTGGGLAIQMKKDIMDATVDGCTFKDNTVTGSTFGNAHTEFCRVTYKNCTFNGNTAENGGGVTALSSEPEFIDCQFTNNTGTQNAGAIYANKLIGDMLVQGSTFDGNKSQGTSKDFGGNGGGAIEVISSAGKNVAINGSTFTGNSSGYFGGAVFVPSNPLGELAVTGSTFTNNSAVSGGAFYVTANNMVITDSTIDFNTASYTNTKGLNGTLGTSGGVHFIPGVNNGKFEVLGDTHIYGNTTPNENINLMVNGVGASSEIYIADTSAKITAVSGLDNMKTVDADGNDYLLTRHVNTSTNASYKYFQRFYSNIAKPQVIYYKGSGKCDHKKDQDNWTECSTFEEAFAAAQAKPDKTLVICGTVQLTDENKKLLENGDNVILQRCSNNTSGSLVEVVCSEASFGNICFDGNAVDTDSASVKVKSGSSVTVNDGAVFKNGKRTTVKGDYSGGGAIEVAYGQSSSKLTINGGTFENNRAMSGGRGTGGAIWAWHTDTTINGGTFSKNAASYSGGAFFTEWDSTLNITGGVFDGNEANEKGGALGLFAVYISSGERGFHGVTTTITGGTFTNNKAYCSQYYAGGAIYNGRGCLLNVRNALITQNYKTYGGKTSADAAVACCDSGSLAVFKSQGALVTKNSKTNSTNDSGALRNSDYGFDGGKGTTVATISDFALGGADCNWTRKTNYEQPDGTMSNKIANKSYYQNTTNSFSIVSNVTDAVVQDAEAHADVLFRGNSASAQGTAIMNNGTMIIGADTKNLEVTKSWEGVEEDEAPEVEVQLARVIKGDDGSEQYELMSTEFRQDAIQKLNKSNGWKAYWTDLPDSDDWVAIEKGVGGYTTAVSGPTVTITSGKAVSTLTPEQVAAGKAEDSDEYEGGIKVVSYAITNTWNDEKTNLSVQKWWEDGDDAYSVRPNSIVFALTSDLNAEDRNGDGKIDYDEYVETGEQATVKLENGEWKHYFTELPKYTKGGQEIHYAVKEVNIPDSEYESAVEIVKDDDGNVVVWTDADGNEWMYFNVTNKHPQKDVELTINKIWKDYDGRELATADIPVSAVQVEILNNGAHYATVELSKDNGWEYTLADLPRDGVYTIGELGDDSYGVEYVYGDGSVTSIVPADWDYQYAATITNTLKKAELTITKAWLDYDGSDLDAQDIPDSVTVNVYNGDALYESIILDADNEWTQTLKGLPLDGKFSVQELDVEGFNVSYAYNGDEDAESISTSNADESYAIDITNTHKKVDLTITKAWISSGGANLAGEDIPVDSIEVNVFNGDDLYTTVTLTRDEDWTKTIYGMPMDGSYTIEELEIEGFEIAYVYGNDSRLESIDPVDGTYSYEASITNTKIDEPEFGKLTIAKRLEGSFQAIDGGKIGEVTAVFHIVGVAEDEDGNEVTVYDQYAGLNFAVDGSRTQEVVLDNLPLGTYTVEEVEYDGDGYVPANPDMVTQTVVLGTKVGTNNEDQLDVLVEYVNNTNGDRPSAGIVNRYRFTPSNEGNPLLDVVRFLNGVQEQN